MSVLDAALEIVGAGGTLTRDEARSCMDEVMHGRVADVQFGALFMGLHTRGETVDELAGCALAMRDHLEPVQAPTGAIDTCGTGGSGTGTFNVSTAAALVAVGAGACVAKHGNRAVSSTCGSADVLEALGGSLATSAAQVEHQLSAAGFGFMFAPAFHPAMRHAAGPRRALGRRTAFNFLGPLVNPAGVRRQVLGTSDAGVQHRLVAVLRELGCEHALVVHGTGGLDEIALHGVTRIMELRGGDITTRDVTPEELGLRRAPLEGLRGGDAATNAGMLRAVLKGEPGPPRDAVLANAGAALVVAGRCDGLREGVVEAGASIDSGAALAALDRWVDTRAEERAS